MNVIIVFLGGGVGAALRYGAGVAALQVLGPTSFPWGTFAVNTVGCFFMGLLAMWLRGSDEPLTLWRLLLGIGVLGGFTTFSSFALESVDLLEAQPMLGALYIAGSVMLGLGGLLAGMAFARALL